MIRNIFGKQGKPRPVPHVIDAWGRDLGTVEMNNGRVVCPIDAEGRTVAGTGGIREARKLVQRHGCTIEYR